MGQRTKKKFDTTVIGMAPELKLNHYLIPKALRNILEKQTKQFSKMTSEEKHYLSELKHMMNVKELSPHSYVERFHLLLWMEEYERELEMRMYDLKDQKIQRQGIGQEFLIHVPGLSEERPSLQLYDEVQLRKNDATNVCNTYISFIGQNYVRVISTPKFAKKYREDHLYNVRFLLPRRILRCAHLAIHLVKLHGLAPAMFPELKTCYNKPSEKLCWFDKNIGNNSEQKQAILNIVARTAHPAPYILFGPPGTGKTATLVEAISQIWSTSPWSHILICTPSNAAADEIVKRLLKNIPALDIHRMYGRSRSWDEVDEQIRPCSNIIDGETVFLPKELIMLRRIVVVSLTSCTRLLALFLRENHFSYVFIDEAGQATEPETLIPLGLMSAASPSHKGRLHGQVVIAGDPMQLGPSVSLKRVDTLAKSMLERLMEQCPPYKKDDTGKYRPAYITKLVRNFRSNEIILHVPNNLFYDGDLIACGKNEVINRAMNYSALPNKSFPMIFHAVSGKESRESNSPSVCNVDEIVVIMQYLQQLIGSELGGRKLKQKDIGIITPYKLQSIKINRQLGKRNWNDVSVGTVEIFQGQERDVIIMSTVRSVIYKHKGKEHIGYLSNPKRFNVAVTRAKSLLITIGNPKILQFDDCWNKLMSYCSQNNAYIGKSGLQKLTKRQKQNLIAKKHVLKQGTNKDFQFPVAPESILVHSKNCTISEQPVRRRPRMPKINKNVTPMPQLESDSGITSTSNSSSTTDLEHQDRASNFSRNDGFSSSSRNDCLLFNSDESNKLLMSATEDTTNDIFPTTSFVSTNLRHCQKEIDCDEYQNALDNSEEFTIWSDEEDIYSLALVEKLYLDKSGFEA